jgi:hypothetical protein
MTALFALTLFASAALVFTLEPMFGKMVLPLLGGAPAVWNTCVVFYQVVLLGGYAYAHLLAARRLGVQLTVHAGLLVAAGLVLPVALPATSPAPGGSPSGWLLGALVAGPGLPLLALCATAPLLQRWIASTGVPAGRDPYFLYAASNAGSLAGLLAYPLLIEPGSTLTLQRGVWALGYVALAAAVVACGAWASRLREYVRARAPSGERGVEAGPGPRAAGEHLSAATARGERLRWVALAAVPSSLLLSVTTYLSTDVAPVPLLWAVPLALYLLSFVLAFASRRLVGNGFLRESMIVFTFLIALTLLLEITRPGWLLAPLHLLGLFVFALALHTALASSRPAPVRLTEFYLCVALGGVVGGLFNTLVAPVVFDSVAEYPAAIAAACLLRPLWKPTRVWPGRVDWIFALALGLLTLALVLGVRAHVEMPPAAVYVFAVGATLVFVLCTTNAPRFGAAVTLLLAAGTAAGDYPRGSTLLHAERTFFGIYRATAEAAPDRHVLANGTTLHGMQLAGREDEPTLYYHRLGPIGDAIEALRPRLAGAQVGVVGLGAGGLAAYARPEERWTFYEIDPAVERIARNRRFFTYLDRCAAACEVVLGDARLSLASAAAPQYRLLILDAFSSDAIPTHLLTREAFALYFERLADDGVAAFHVSNRHLNLTPLVAALAAERGYVAIEQSFRADPLDVAQSNSDWVLVARTLEPLAPLVGDGGWSTLDRPASMRVWTDDFSDILGIFLR